MAEIEFRFQRSVQGTPAYWGPGYLTIPGPSGSVPSQRAALAWNPPGVAGAVVFSGAPDGPGDTRVWVVRMEHDPARTIIPIIDYGGSTPGGVAGGTNLGSTPSNVRVVWSPTGTAPAELFVASAMPAGVLTHSGLLVEMPTWEAAPAGVSQEWTSQPAGTAVNSFWGASGPWEPASGAQTITVQSASVVSGKEVTIPVWATVAGVVGTLTQPGAALQPILVDADGCVSPSAAKVELPAVGAGANVRRLPRWLIRDTGPLQWKLESTAAGVVSYAPFYVVPPLPPTPGPPIIVKLIPASGPDTGGTTVNVVGTDLTGAAVDFDGTAGTGLTVDPSGNLATVTSPAHTAGPAPVTITTPAGTSNAETFTYEAPLPPGGPVVVAVIPGAALPGATIQIVVGTNLTGATVTMCGETVAIVSNDGTIITVVVPPGCPDGDTTITVTTPDGETTVEFAVLPVPEPGECPSLTDWCAPDTPCPDCTPCVVAPARPLIAMWADLAARIRCGWPDDRCPPGAVTVEATQQPPGSDCDAEVQVIPGGPAGADHAGVTTWGGRVVVLRPWAQINEAGQLTDAAQAQRLEAIARSLEDLQIMQQLIVAAACGACGPGGATIDRVERVTSTTTLGWAFAVRIS
jgi:hypothetical protein